MLKLYNEDYKKSIYYVDINYESALKDNPTEMTATYCAWLDERGSCHRDGNPAIIYTDNSLYWCNNGNFHREDGPAIISKAKTVNIGQSYNVSFYWILRWYYNNKEIHVASQADFEREIKLKAFW